MKKIIVTSLMFFLLLAGILSAEMMPDLIEREHFYFIADNTQFLEEVEAALTDARRLTRRLLNDSLSYKPRIYIEDDLHNFKRLIGTAFPDWGAAAALPYRELIAIKSPAHFRLGKSLRELVMHEYGHLALQHRLNHARPPRWLDEGVAMHVSSEWRWGDNLAMSQAVVLGSLVPLRKIEKLNLFPQGQARTAYAQSYMAVRYILDTYGPESFQILLDRLRGRASTDEALMAALGSNYEGFEKEYLSFLKGRFNIMTLIGDLSFLWLFLALVVIIGFILRFRRKRKYYDRWDKEEKYQSTDFDYGDPDNPEQIDDEDKPWA